MPKTTQAYPFEWKILDFARGLSAALAGGDGRAGFVILFDDSGSARKLQFECPENGWHSLTKSLDEAGAAYLIYDPFEAPEYTWLRWRRVSRATMERLIGQRLEAADFVKAQHATSRAPDLEASDEFPASWSVMF